MYSEMWRRSGQNNPKKFLDFLAKRGDVLYALSMRVLIMFKAAKMGTPNADTYFIDVTSKAIASGGYAKGLPSQESQVLDNGENSSRETTSQRVAGIRGH